MVLDRVDRRDRWWADVRCLTPGRAEDMYLATFTASTGDMRESHMVCQSVHDAPLLRRQGRGKDERFPGVVVAEEEQLRVELKSLGVVQVYV